MLEEHHLAQLLEQHGLLLVRYRVGEGGSAVVHRAKVAMPDTKLSISIGEEVAIKEYKDEVMEKAEQLARIRQEVHVGDAVAHANVVRIYGIIDIADKPLLVMEWVDGKSLDVWVRESARSWAVVANIASGLIDGVRALHEAGVKHRDIKPANVFITTSGPPVLMDMGVVELTANDKTTLHTKIGDFIGSVRYACPQYIRGEPFEFPDDIYALAATLFFLVSGREVFSDVERKPLLPFFILTSRAEIGELSEGFPQQLAVVIEGALNADRGRRPSLDELFEAINSPDGCSYIQRELDARKREERGFKVVAVHDQGASVFADLRGGKPFNEEFVVVRETTPTHVPSLGGQVKLEKWIADVELKHVQDNVGHFALKGRRWVDGKLGYSEEAAKAMGLGTPGKWVEFEREYGAVQVGDIVVRRKR